MTPRTKRIVTSVFLLAFAVIGLIAFVRAILSEVRSAGATGEPGVLIAPTFDRPADVPLPRLTDVAEEWGFGNWSMEGVTAMRGGVALGDLDADGRLDVVVTGGSVAVWRNTGDGFESVLSSISGDATSAAIGDLDGDGSNDLIVGFSDQPLTIAWGGWSGPTQALGPAGLTTGVVVADVTDDGQVDLVQLGYGDWDRVWLPSNGRNFESRRLPNSNGLSMVASVFDADADGRNDIWVTRDVGWSDGADAVYAWNEANDWFVDISERVGGGQAIDGMGITVADLNDDGHLDVYLSDVGDNELLVGGEDGRFLEEEGASANIGIARIRPPGHPVGFVSSSWGSGATDLNHDGVLDLVIANGGFVNGTSAPNKVTDTEILIDDTPAILVGLGFGIYTDVWEDTWDSASAPFTRASRGMALGDLDGDNDADIVIANFGGGLTVLRNDQEGPVAKVTGAGCTGARLEFTGADGERVVTVLGAQSFLGHHASEFTIGRPGGTEAGQTWDLTVNGEPVGSVAVGDTKDVSASC